MNGVRVFRPLKKRTSKNEKGGKGQIKESKWKHAGAINAICRVNWGRLQRASRRHQNGWLEGRDQRGPTATNISCSFISDISASLRVAAPLAFKSRKIEKNRAGIPVMLGRKCGSCSSFTSSCSSPPLLLPPTPPLRRFQRMSAGSRCPIRPAKLVNNSQPPQVFLGWIWDGFMVFDFLLQVYPEPSSQKTIFSSVVFCIHRKEGCDWTGELRKLKVIPFPHLLHSTFRALSEHF